MAVKTGLSKTNWKAGSLEITLKEMLDVVYEAPDMEKVDSGNCQLFIMKQPLPMSLL